MKKTIVVAGILFFTLALTAMAGILGDIDSNQKVDLNEAVYALQVASGLRDDSQASYVIVWRNSWTPGTEYKKYDAVSYDGASYICMLLHTANESETPPENSLWGILSQRGQKGDKGDKGDTGEKGDQGDQGQKGDKGDQGEIGLQGHPGPKGDTGPAGSSPFEIDGGNAYFTAGSIGIGMTAPAYKLDIEGDMNISGVFRMGGSPVLKADSSNLFIGKNAGLSIAAGAGGNTFIGNDVGRNTGTGFNNTFIGKDAGLSNNVGAANSFIGNGAGNKNLSGSNNIFIGQHAGYRNTAGNNNTALGHYAGYNNTTGEGNVFIGHRAGYNESESNKLYIDNSDTSTPLIYGDFGKKTLSVFGSIGINTAAYDKFSLYVNGDAYTTGGTWQASDIRWKKNIVPIKDALRKISQVVGVSYEWKREEYPDKEFAEGKQIGVIAQEVESVIPEVVHTDAQGYKAVSLERLTPVLIEAVKEQQAQIELLKAEIELLKREIKGLPK